MVDYKVAMNDPVMWLMCVPAVAVAVVQAILISRKTIQAGHVVNLSKKESIKAFKTGAIAAIGPSISSVVVMISLMATIGPAFSWLRLCFIGSATTEMTAAGIGAAAMGVELGGEGYDINAFANSVWACTLNAFGWLVVAGIFTPRLNSIRTKIAGTDGNLMGVISTAAMVGVFVALSIGYINRGILAIGSSIDTSKLAECIPMITFLVGGVTMFAAMQLGKKFPKVREHTLSITLVIGLLVACILLSAGGLVKT